MAKKKINIKSVSTDVESGDVNISYKNVRIAGLSESTTAVLETKDTICEDDIEVEYTKSGGNANMYVRFSKSGGSWNADKTYGEILAAIQNDTVVIGIFTDISSNTGRYPAFPLCASLQYDHGEPAGYRIDGVVTFLKNASTPEACLRKIVIQDSEPTYYISVFEYTFNVSAVS